MKHKGEFTDKGRWEGIQRSQQLSEYSPGRPNKSLQRSRKCIVSVPLFTSFRSWRLFADHVPRCLLAKAYLWLRWADVELEGEGYEAQKRDSDSWLDEEHWCFPPPLSFPCLLPPFRSPLWPFSTLLESAK
jgi:hypothetical protein